MKEQIYTIPVMDAFKEDCECPLCLLEKRFENELTDYMLGPSLMEPDVRIDTNEKGFCRRHFKLLYNRQENRLGLGLIIDTHLVENIARLRKVYNSKAASIRNESGQSLMKSLTSAFTSKSCDTGKFIDEFVSSLIALENKCAICSKLGYTMDRYIDVIFCLWFRENEFRQLFNEKKSFCLKHLKELLLGCKKYLDTKKQAIFIDNLLPLQLDNLMHTQEEVNWFTRKFDYRNNDAPWGNSRDAIPRSIRKIVGNCDLK